MKKIYLIVVFIASLIGIQSCTVNSNDTEAEEHHQSGVIELSPAQCKRAGIDYGKIELKNLSAAISVNGMLDVPPQNLVSVSAMMGGFIKSTELPQGMQVKKGSLIATIQNPDFIQIQSQYLENKQKLQYLELEYKRQEELAKENVASAKTFQQVSSEYNSLLATLGALEERLKILNINPATLTQSTIRSIVSIYAPINGYVTVVNVNIGSFVNPQDIICEIVDTEHLHAELTVFEKDITKVKKGQKIRFVLVNESDKERTGSVYLINHKISEDRTVRVHAHLDKEDPSLIPNMYLKALIEIGNNQTTALPDQAIVSSEGKELIFIKTTENLHKKEDSTANATPDDGIHFKAIEIKKGVSQNGYTEITLPEGLDGSQMEVVIKGAYALLATMNNSEDEDTH